MRLGPLSYQSAFDLLRAKGYQPVPGSSRFEDAAGRTGRIVEAEGRGDTWYAEAEEGDADLARVGQPCPECGTAMIDYGAHGTTCPRCAEAEERVLAGEFDPAVVPGYEENAGGTFAEGFAAGRRDREASHVRQLCTTGTGERPPVVKRQGRDYYHGYKAAAEGATSEPSAYLAYRAKHRGMSGMAANGQPGDEYESNARRGAQASKPGRHGTLYLWRVTYRDTIDPGFGESSVLKWAYDKQHVWDVFNEQVNAEGESWEIVKIDPAAAKEYEANASRRDPVETLTDPEAVKAVLRSLRVKSGLTSTSASLGGKWSIRFGYNRDHSQFTTTLTHFGASKSMTVGLLPEDVETRSKGQWMTSNTYRLTEPAIERLAEQLVPAMRNFDAKYAAGMAANPERGTTITAAEVSALPVGSILWADHRGWVVVPGGIAPISLLTERAGGRVPDGEPAGTISPNFEVVREGNGKVPTYGTAQRHVIAWYQGRRATPNPVHLALDGNFSFGIGTKDDTHMKKNAAAKGEVIWEDNLLTWTSAGVDKLGNPRGLNMTATPEGRVLAQDMLAERQTGRRRGILAEQADFFDVAMGNGWQYVPPEGIGALTDATIVSMDGFIGDDGKWYPHPDVEEPVVYAHMNYEVEDPIESWAEGKPVFWQAETIEMTPEGRAAALEELASATGEAYEPNARKNVTAVINAFMEGRRLGGTTVSTDGQQIFSYAMPIAGWGAGGVVVLDAKAAPSRTTASHIRAVQSAMPEARVVAALDPPAEGHSAGRRPLGWEPMRANAAIDADKIKAALRMVHHAERTSTNPGGKDRAVAYRQAVRDYGLNDAEADILGNALHVSAHERNARGSKPWFGQDQGNVGHWAYAIKIDGIENDFPLKPLGRQEEWPAVRAFQASARTTWINAKHDRSGGMNSVKRFVKSEPRPDQFYAKWSPGDDSFQIWYTVGEAAESHTPNWGLMLDLGGVERRLGADHVAAVLGSVTPHAVALGLANDALDANDVKRHEAYTSLARMIDDGDLDDLIASARGRA